MLRQNQYQTVWRLAAQTDQRLIVRVVGRASVLWSACGRVCHAVESITRLEPAR